MMLGTLVNIKYESEFGKWVREREREEEKVRLTGRKRTGYIFNPL